MKAQAFVTAQKNGKAYAFKIAFNEGIEDAKVTETKVFKCEASNLLEDLQRLPKSILKDQALYYFYDKESLVKLNLKDLEVIEDEEIESDESKECRSFGLIQDWAADELAIYVNSSI